jgi:DHA3 family macrolide efflux protein-like MFS transporter
VSAFLQGGIVAGGLLMSVFSGFKNRMTVIALSLYVIFAGYVSVALTPTGLFWFMAVSVLVMAFCLPIANVLTQTIVQGVVPLKMQGRVGSVIGAIASAATPVGMIISGPIAAFAGTANLFLGCAALGTALLTVSWLFTDVRFVERMNVPVGERLTALSEAAEKEVEQPK